MNKIDKINGSTKISGFQKARDLLLFRVVLRADLLYAEGMFFDGPKTSVDLYKKPGLPIDGSPGFIISYG